MCGLNVLIQLLEMGLLKSSLRFRASTGLPILFSSRRAKRAFAARCWGVCACVTMVPLALLLHRISMQSGAHAACEGAEKDTDVPLCLKLWRGIRSGIVGMDFRAEEGERGDGACGRQRMSWETAVWFPRKEAKLGE